VTPEHSRMPLYVVGRKSHFHRIQRCQRTRNLVKPDRHDVVGLANLAEEQEVLSRAHGGC
jgi:hypothetical protein